MCRIPPAHAGLRFQGWFAGGGCVLLLLSDGVVVAPPRSRALLPAVSRLPVVVAQRSLRTILRSATLGVVCVPYQCIPVPFNRASMMRLLALLQPPLTIRLCALSGE